MKERLTAFLCGYCTAAGIFLIAISTLGAIAYLSLLIFALLKEAYLALY
jgi:hypothetical protein